MSEIWAEFSEMYPWDDERGLLVAYVDVLHHTGGLWPSRVGVVTILDLGDSFAWSAYSDGGGCAGQGTEGDAAQAGAAGFAALGGDPRRAP